jgi:hypothetical protein
MRLPFFGHYARLVPPRNPPRPDRKNTSSQPKPAQLSRQVL